MAESIRILICDDHALFREGLKALLGHEAGLEIVGEASDGRAAIERVGEVHPDVVLMDIAMPELIGYEAAHRMRKIEPRVRILMLTMHADEESIARSLDAGAAGYILKESPATQLVYAIRQVHGGGQYYDPGVTSTVLKMCSQRSDQPMSSYQRLSSREREVLKLLAEGSTVKEVAARLQVSIKTIETHKYNLMLKLDLHDRAQLIRYALQNRLITLSG